MTGARAGGRGRRAGRVGGRRLVTLLVGLTLVAGVTGCQGRRADAPADAPPEVRSGVSSEVASGSTPGPTFGETAEGTSARAAEAEQAASIEAALRAADQVLASLDDAFASDP